MAAVIGALRADLSASVAKFEQDMGRAAQVVEKFGRDIGRISQRMEQAGSRMTALITAPIAAFGVTALRAAGDFEQSMNRVQALTSATGDQLKALSDQARELGGTTQFSASDAADAMGFLAQAGMQVNDIMAAMPHVLTLAGAAQLDMASAADIVTNILSGYNLEVTALASANDTLVAAFTKANTDLTQLAEAMKYAGPVASAAGVQFEEAAAALAMMGNAGIQGSMAGTSLRGAIARILSPTKQMADAMRAAGLSFTDAQGRLLPLSEIIQRLEPHADNAGLFMDLFGQRAGPAMAALVSQGSDALRTLTGELEDAGGAAERISTVQMQGFNGAMKELESAFEELQLRIAESGLMDFAAAAVLAITDLLLALGNLPDPILAVGTALAGLVAVIGPALWAFGAFLGSVANIAPLVASVMRALTPLISQIGGLGVVAARLPALFGPLAAVLGVVVAAAWEFRAAFAEAFGYLVTQFQTQVLPALQALGAAFGRLFDAIGDLMSNGPLGELVRFVGWVVAEIGALLMQGLGHGFMTVATTIVDALTVVVDAITGMVRIVSAVLSGDFVGAWEAAWAVVVGVLDGILSVLDNFFPGLQAAVREIAAAFQQWVGEAVAATLAWIQARFPGLVEAAAAMARGVVAWARSLYEGVKTWINDNLGPVIRWARDRIRELSRLFALVRRRQDQLRGKNAPAAAGDGAGAEGGGGAPPAAQPPAAPPETAGGSDSDKTAKRLKEATERLQEALEDVQDNIDRAFGRDEMPRSLRAAADLNRRLDEMAEEARDAGVNMSAFAESIQEARDRIEELKQAALAREAREFALRVEAVADEVDDLSGSLSPLETSLRDVDRRFADLRFEIEEGIRQNALLAESNEDAAAAMRVLERQLDRIADAQTRAAEGARKLFEAQERLRDLQAAADAGDLERQIRDAQQAGGRRGFMTEAARELQRIEDDLAQQRMDAAMALASLEADLVQAELAGDEAQMERLRQQIALQSQLYEIVSATSAEQIRAAARLQNAFSDFVESLSDELADTVMEWSVDLEGLRGVFKQLARELFIKPVTDSFSAGIGNFLKGFAGGFATGGTLRPGEWGIAGENGPEPIFAGARSLTVTPHEEGFGRRGRGDVIFNVTTPNADSFRYSERQLARRAKEALGSA